jgi:phytoene dehydrogenase-like protein
VWQTRWLGHPNGARGLLDLVIAVADLDEAAARFQRFTGRPALTNASGRAIHLDRGRVQLVTPARLAEIVGSPLPHPPVAAAYALAVQSLETAGQALRRGGIDHEQRGHFLLTRFPEDLGVGAWVFAEDARHLPWRR